MCLMLPYYEPAPGWLTGLSSRKRDELHGDRPPLDDASRSSLDDGDPTRVPPRSDRNHEAAGRRQLIDQRPGNLVRCGGDDDAVERGMLGPPRIAVSLANADVRVAKLTQEGRCGPGEPRNDLDRVDFARQQSENRRLVSRAGADLEDSMRRFDAEHLGHIRNDVWLRDGLAEADRQRRVIVGGGGRFFRYKPPPGRASRAAGRALWVTPASRICRSTMSSRRSRMSSLPFCANGVQAISIAHTAASGPRVSGLLKPPIRQDLDDPFAVKPSILDEDVARIPAGDRAAGDEQIRHVTLEGLGIQGR